MNHLHPKSLTTALLSIAVSASHQLPEIGMWHSPSQPAPVVHPLCRPFPSSPAACIDVKGRTQNGYEGLGRRTILVGAVLIFSTPIYGSTFSLWSNIIRHIQAHLQMLRINWYVVMIWQSQTWLHWAIDLLEVCKRPSLDPINTSRCPKWIVSARPSLALLLLFGSEVEHLFFVRHGPSSISTKPRGNASWSKKIKWPRGRSNLHCTLGNHEWVKRDRPNDTTKIHQTLQDLGWSRCQNLPALVRKITDAPTSTAMSKLRTPRSYSGDLLHLARFQDLVSGSKMFGPRNEKITPIPILDPCTIGVSVCIGNFAPDTILIQHVCVDASEYWKTAQKPDEFDMHTQEKSFWIAICWSK